MNPVIHTCPILMYTVIWENGECQVTCEEREEDCPLTVELDYEEGENRD